MNKKISKTLIATTAAFAAGVATISINVNANNTILETSSTSVKSASVDFSTVTILNDNKNSQEYYGNIDFWYYNSDESSVEKYHATSSSISGVFTLVTDELSTWPTELPIEYTVEGNTYTTTATLSTKNSYDTDVSLVSSSTARYEVTFDNLTNDTFYSTNKNYADSESNVEYIDWQINESTVIKPDDSNDYDISGTISSVADRTNVDKGQQVKTLLVDVPTIGEVDFDNVVVEESNGNILVDGTSSMSNYKSGNIDFYTEKSGSNVSTNKGDYDSSENSISGVFSLSNTDTTLNSTWPEHVTVGYSILDKDGNLSSTFTTNAVIVDSRNETIPSDTTDYFIEFDNLSPSTTYTTNREYYDQQVLLGSDISFIDWSVNESGNVIKPVESSDYPDVEGEFEYETNPGTPTPVPTHPVDLEYYVDSTLFPPEILSSSLISINDETSEAKVIIETTMTPEQMNDEYNDYSFEYSNDGGSNWSTVEYETISPDNAAYILDIPVTINSTNNLEIRIAYEKIDDIGNLTYSNVYSSSIDASVSSSPVESVELLDSNPSSLIYRINFSMTTSEVLVSYPDIEIGYYVDGKTYDKQVINIPSNSQNYVDFSISSLSTGEHEIMFYAQFNNSDSAIMPSLDIHDISTRQPEETVYYNGYASTITSTSMESTVSIVSSAIVDYGELTFTLFDNSGSSVESVVISRESYEYSQNDAIIRFDFSYKLTPGSSFTVEVSDERGVVIDTFGGVTNANPTPGYKPGDSNNNSTSPELSTGAVVGITIGSIAAALAAVIGIIIFRKK